MNIIKTIYNKYKEIIKYLIFGVITTILALSVYYISVCTFLNPQNKVELQIANIISWIAGVILAYITNRKYVFESKDKRFIKEIIKFIQTRLITLVMDMSIMWLGVSILAYNDKIIKITSQIVVIIANYIFSKIYIFRKEIENEL